MWLDVRLAKMPPNRLAPSHLHEMVHARSIVASRIGAAGYKLMRSSQPDMDIIVGPDQHTWAEEKENHIIRRLAKREHSGLNLNPSWPSCETLRLI